MPGLAHCHSFVRAGPMTFHTALAAAAMARPIFLHTGPTTAQSFTNKAATESKAPRTARQNRLRQSTRRARAGSDR